MQIGTHRPRNVGWARAAALLYGRLGHQQGLRHRRGLFGRAVRLAADHRWAVCLLTGLVGYNYSLSASISPTAGVFILRRGCKAGFWRYWVRCFWWRT